jgi:hypothetical protein
MYKSDSKHQLFVLISIVFKHFRYTCIANTRSFIFKVRRKSNLDACYPSFIDTKTNNFFQVNKGAWTLFSEKHTQVRLLKKNQLCLFVIKNVLKVSVLEKFANALQSMETFHLIFFPFDIYLSK